MTKPAAWLRNVLQSTVEATRSSFVLQRQDIFAGIRVTIIALVPLIIGPLLGEPLLGLMGFLSGLYAATADPGGAYRNRAISMGTATLCMALAAYLATITGNIPWLAIPLVFVCAFGASMFGVFGDIGSKVSFATIGIFLVILGEPDQPGMAFVRLMAFLVGGSWAMVVSLWLWPLHPYQPLQQAIANYYRVLGSLLAGICYKIDNNGPSWNEMIMRDRARVKQAHDTAHNAVKATRSSLEGGNPPGQQLFRLTLQADDLFSLAVALVEDIQVAPGQTQAQLQATLTAVAQQAANVLYQIADALIHDSHEVDVGGLDQVIAALASEQEAPPQVVADYVAFVNLHHITCTLRTTANNIHSVLDALQHLQQDQHPRRHLLAGRHLPQPHLKGAIYTLRNNLTSQSLVFRHALRLGVATTVATALYTLLHIPHGFWIPLTILFILKPDFGGTQRQIFLRIAGTILGGVLVAVLAGLIHNGLVLYILFAGFSILAYSYRTRNYFVFVLFMTPFIVLLINLNDPGDWQIALLRILNTLIGALIAFLASYLFWPFWESERLPTQLARTTAANHAFFSCVLSAYLGQSVDISDTSEQAHLESINASAAFQRLLSEPKTKRGPVDQFYALVTYNQHFCDSVTALAAHLPTLSHHHSLPGLQQFTRCVETLLTRVEAAMQTDNQPEQSSAPIARLEESLQTIQASVQILIEARTTEIADKLSQTASNEAVIDFLPVVQQLEQITDDVAGMYRLACLERV